MVTAASPKTDSQRALARWSPGGLALHVTANRLPPHLDRLNREILDLVQGITKGTGPYRDYIGLIVTMPPRHGKSEMCSHHTPAWFVGNYPDMTVGLTSYEASFAASWGRKARDLIEEHGDLFAIRLRQDSQAAARWEVTGHKGGMFTAGVGGPITGRGANLLIIDDPIKNQEEATSPLDRQKKWDWWRSVARPRLEPGGKAVLIMTRWHDDDLAGRLLRDMEEGGDKWRVVNFAALAEVEDELGRAEGEALWPSRYPSDVLIATRRALGPYWWGAMYQQRPQAEGGGVLRLDYWRAYQADQLPRMNRIYQAWDTAFKLGEMNDYSVCATIGEFGERYYVLDIWRARLEFPELVRAVQAQWRKWGAERVYIEDAASGQSAHQVLRRMSGIPIIAKAADRDKIARARAITGYLEAGLVLLPENAEWLADFLDETSHFPTAQHDDQVDALVHCLGPLIEATLRGDRRSTVEDPLGLLGRTRSRVTPDNPLGLDMTDPRYRDRG